MPGARRLAVIGAGAWGLNHVRVIATDPRCKLAGIVDVSGPACDRAQQLAATNVFRDVDAVLADRSIDAVVISTPAPSHARLATAALEAGKHVLVEKPLALSVGEARSVVDAARRHHRIAAVGHLMVFHPVIERMRELVSTGDLGPWRYVHSSRANSGRIRADESALWSFGPHELSMLEFILDCGPLSVGAVGQDLNIPGVADVAFVSLRYADGQTASLHLSRVHPRKERSLTVVFANKMLEFDDMAPQKLRIYDRSDGQATSFTDFGEYLTLRDSEMHAPLVPMVEPLRAQLWHFLDCVEGRAEPRADAARALYGISVLEAAQRSLDGDGRLVTIEEAIGAPASGPRKHLSVEHDGLRGH